MYSKIIEFISDKFSVLSNILVFVDGSVVFRVLIPLSILVGVGIGLVGSISTMRKYLKV